MAELHADPAVMATLGPVMDPTASDAAVERFDAGFDAGTDAIAGGGARDASAPFGLWCVEFEGACVGFTGLSRPWFRDGVEIGWRLRRDAWGQGIATEAALAVLEYGFDVVGLDQVISFTAAINDRSRAVMTRIGLRHHRDEDFDHPVLAPGDPLRPHVLYRLGVDEYRTRP